MISHEIVLYMISINLPAYGYPLYQSGMLSEAKRGDFKFMADTLFITQQFTFLTIDAKSHGHSLVLK